MVDAMRVTFAKPFVPKQGSRDDSKAHSVPKAHVTV